MVLSFLLVGQYAVERFVRLPDSALWGVATLTISVGAGLLYVWRAPWTRPERIAVTVLYVPVMVAVLLLYGIYFSMIVLGQFL